MVGVAIVEVVVAEVATVGVVMRSLQWQWVGCRFSSDVVAGKWGWPACG